MLLKDYTGHVSVLVADVDCVGDGKTKCDEVGIKNFPSIKYGNPNNLEDRVDVLTFLQRSHAMSGHINTHFAKGLHRRTRSPEPAEIRAGTTPELSPSRAPASLMI